MINKGSLRPSAKSIVFTMLLTLVAIISMNALPAMRAGQPTWSALRSVVQTAGFWRVQILPIGVMYALMLFVFPTVYEFLIRRRGEPERRFNWARNRLLITLGGLVFIVATAAPVISHLLRGTRSYSTDQLAFVGLLWLFYLGLVAAAWLRRPSSEWVHGFETGDHSRSMDERYQLVLGKSATSTLYLTLVLLLVAGSLYDILINKTWPARSLAEVAIIFVLWNIIYNRVNRAV